MGETSVLTDDRLNKAKELRFGKAKMGWNKISRAIGVPKWQIWKVLAPDLLERSRQINNKNRSLYRDRRRRNRTSQYKEVGPDYTAAKAEIGEEKSKTILALRAQGVGWRKIEAFTGISRWKLQKAFEPEIHERYRKRNAEYAETVLKSPWKPRKDGEAIIPERAPLEVLREREVAYSFPLTTSISILGDPVPSRSALGKQKQSPKEENSLVVQLSKIVVNSEKTLAARAALMTKFQLRLAKRINELEQST